MPTPTTALLTILALAAAETVAVDIVREDGATFHCVATVAVDAECRITITVAENAVLDRAASIALANATLEAVRGTVRGAGFATATIRHTWTRGGKTHKSAWRTLGDWWYGSFWTTGRTATIQAKAA